MFVVLPYEDVRRSADPEAAAHDFFESTCRAAADNGGWAHRLERR
ncbi:MAG: DUF5996 family protein [Actinomycetota bacterium]|nr:DUF5996 family protein [Actinomycetota bacterium]